MLNLTLPVVVANLANNKFTMTNHLRFDGEVLDKCLCVNYTKASFFLTMAFFLILLVMTITVILFLIKKREIF